MEAAEGLAPTPRYEDSRLDVCVYELHVWLLAADRRTVIAQHHVAPRTSGRGPPGHWVQVRLPTPSATRTRAFASQDLTEGGEQGLWVPHKNFFLTLVLPRCPTYSASTALASALSTSCTRPRTGWSTVGCCGRG